MWSRALTLSQAWRPSVSMEGNAAGLPVCPCGRCREWLSAGAATTFVTHHLNEARTPECADCHVEHGGNAILTRAIGDVSCTVCHADLANNISASAGQAIAIVTSAGSKIRALTSAIDGHVEFAAHSHPDMAALALNHSRHLPQGEKGSPAPLPSMDTEGRQAWLKDTGRNHMVCADCHEPDSSRRYMKPIRFKDHCIQCHDLQVAQEYLPPEKVPHGLEPSRLVDFVKGMGSEAEAQKGYETYIDAHPEKLNLPKGKKISREDWLTKRTEAWKGRNTDSVADALLHAEKDGCARCHKLEGEGLAVKITPTRVPARWLLHSFFHHEKHNVVKCEVCHPNARTSEKTEDVLLPKVDVCRDCHTKGGARDNCTTCHTYHDRGSDRRDMEGRISRSDLIPSLERKP